MLQPTKKIKAFVTYEQALRHMGTVIVLFGLFLVCFIWIGLYYKIQGERKFEMESAVKATANLARAFEEHTSRTINGADQVSLFIKYEYEKEGQAIDFFRYISDGRLSGQSIYILNILDENGDTLFSNQSTTPSNMKDREHFLIHTSRDTGTLYIGKPIFRRSLNKWVIPMSRRINKPDGSFGGVVLVSLDPYYFNEFYRQVDLGEKGNIVLVGRDYIVRARQSGQSSQVGQDLSNSVLRRKLTVNDRGDYIATSPVDGIKRLYNYRALADYPLIVSVGIAEDEVMRAVNRRIAGYYLAAGLVTAIILSFIFVLLRIAVRQKKTESELQKARDNLESQVAQRTCELFEANAELQIMNRELEGEIRDRKKTEERLRQQEEALLTSRETLSLAAELAHVGPWVYSAETDLFEFGDEFYAIYGTSMALEGRFMAPAEYIRNFVHPDDAWMVEAAVGTVQSSASPDVEHRIIRRDGEVRTIVVRANVIRDANGRIFKYYGANQDITDQMQARESLRMQAEDIRHMAYFDVLTGLPNRAQLSERLNLELARARKGGSAGVVLFIDADDLKMVNDTFGHTCGDNLIRITGERIAREVDEGALVGRIGGDEFMVILPGEAGRNNIRHIAERMIKAISQEIETFGTKFHITASMGIAFYPEDGETSEDIFKNADNAMYAAKKSGKNCWRVYEAAMQQEAYDAMLLKSSLRNAIKNGELSLYYQPQVSLAEGQTVGFEALLRWHSTEHGSIPPARFIPLAEQSGLIHFIGQWVLKEACLFVRRLTGIGFGHVCVAVNVSPQQLCDDGFIDSVRKTILNTGIEPHQLELEITENALIASLEESIRKLDKLREMGVRLSLDDFGKGYSSLTYLRRLPVKTLKIDKEFIDTILAAGDQKAIIGTIITMAHTMRMTVVAEGAEKKEQIEYLSQCGCDLVQGYIISRPLPEDEAVEYLWGKEN